MKIVLALFCAGFLFLLIRFLEIRSIYFPYKKIEAAPSDAGLKFEEIFFETADHKKLCGWFVPAVKEGDTVLFSHGNAGNISHRIEKLLFFNRLGLNVFIFDYRGYGKSRGWPSEKGLYRDAEAAYDYLRSRGVPHGKIIGYGESIGGAVTTDLALNRPMKAIILENTFTNMHDMVRIYFPIVPPRILMSRFESKQKIASIKIPKLIIQSENDEIVPARLGKELFEAAARPKEFLAIHGGHNESFFESEDLIEPRLRDFLK